MQVTLPLIEKHESVIIFNTAYHLTFSDFNTSPSIACSGKCKKSFWQKVVNDYENGLCPTCGGQLCEAVAGVHFNILATANRQLRLSDFLKVTAVSSNDKKSIKSILSKGGIEYLSIVKPAFIEKARREWCN